jgi:hypothetical protein
MNARQITTNSNIKRTKYDMDFISQPYLDNILQKEGRTKARPSFLSFLRFKKRPDHFPVQ